MYLTNNELMRVNGGGYGLWAAIGGFITFLISAIEGFINPICGGSITATFINAIVKGLSLLIELGKSLGSSFRRITSGQTCSIE